MIDKLDNAIQFSVLLVTVIAAICPAVTKRSRTWALLTFFLGSWCLGDLYWLVCYLYYDTMPQISLVSDLNWYASCIFLYMFLRHISPPEGKKHRLSLLGPVFTAGMAVFFMQWGEILNNLIYAALMGLLLFASIDRLIKGQQRAISALVLSYCLFEYGLWIS